ncbi:glycosyltransferase family 39 protein [Synechococcus sp. RC10A2]|uniref:glycosyltransferase family 39 protein n=1 Tax=Synechococcus sp. RC10A2 TaxID=2964529 RepID=UPI0039C6775F
MSRATLWLWLTVIALRLAYAPLATQIDPLLRANPLHGDAILHDQMAWRLVSTGEYRLDKGLMTAPAYIYLMAGVYALAGHAPMAVRLLNALLGLLALWGLWRLTHRLAGERAANLALLLGALHPHLLMITGWLYTENLALPLMVWAVYGLLYWRSGWGWAASGALLGLLALTRANLLPFVAIAGAWQLWHERNWHAPALTVATALLTVAPYVAYISARYGAFIPIGRGGYVLLWANNAHADGGYDPHFLERRLTLGGETKLVREWLSATDPVERDRQAMRLALQWIRENPVQWLWLLGRKLALTLSAFGLQNPENRGVAAALRLADGVYWLFLALAGYGLWRLRQASRAFALLAALFLGWTLLTILLYAGGSRPLLPAQPLITLGAAVGVCALWARRQAQM